MCRSRSVLVIPAVSLSCFHLIALALVRTLAAQNIFGQFHALTRLLSHSAPNDHLFRTVACPPAHIIRRDCSGQSHALNRQLSQSVPLNPSTWFTCTLLSLRRSYPSCRPSLEHYILSVTASRVVIVWANTCTTQPPRIADRGLFISAYKQNCPYIIPLARSRPHIISPKTTEYFSRSNHLRASSQSFSHFPAYGPLQFRGPALVSRCPCQCSIRQYLVTIVGPRT